MDVFLAIQLTEFSLRNLLEHGGQAMIGSICSWFLQLLPPGNMAMIGSSCITEVFDS
jgi:hypothetical protein